MATRRDPREPEQGAPSKREALAPSEALRRRVLASAVTATRLDGFLARFAGLFDLPEARAREILGAAEGAAGSGWVAAPLSGVRLFHFDGGPRVAAADCGLVRVAPGVVFPRHRHRGVEWNLVLAGSAEESEGSIWLPGDLVIREADSVHGFRVLSGEPLLFAVVLEGGIEVLGEQPA